MPLWFFHVGGYYSNVKRNAYKIPMSADQLANYLLAPKVKIKTEDDEGLKFFLGVTPCGASYLLIPSPVVAANAYLNSVFEGRAWPSTSFISLSPIYFSSVHALSARLSLLTNKRTKGAQGSRDRSQANVSFTTASGDVGVLQEAGIDRASFEYHRVFYRMCRGTIDPFEYGAERVAWFNDIDTVWSFAYNTWKMDHRTLKERQQDPKVLDISWTEYVPPGSSSELYTIKTSHFVVEESKMLRNPARASFLHGETEEAKHAVISASLRKIFDERSRPLVLLVYDVKWALLVLGSFGVDTSTWTVGIEPAIGRETLSLPSHGSGRDRSRYDARAGHTAHGGRERSARSRSPGRGQSSLSRARSPPMMLKSRFPVYVVDVKNLYITMKQVSYTNDTVDINSVARGLQLNLDQPDQPMQNSNAPLVQRGWCAGNESRLIGYIWSAMASGNAIDEQRLARFPSIVQKTQEEPNTNPSQGPSSVPAPGDSDSDRDPNDFVLSGNNSRTATTAAKDPYASDEDDYVDF